MIAKKELQYYSNLLIKKHRKQENKFIVEGRKSVAEGLKSKYNCDAIFVTDEFYSENEIFISEINSLQVKLIRLKQKEFQKIADTRTPQGIAAVFQKRNLKAEENFPFNDSIIPMLDGVSDPGNLGTIIRSCDWFGIKTILLYNSVEYTNPKVLRSSMGSVFHTDIYELDDLNLINELRKNNFEILCTDTTGENIFKYKSEKRKLIIFSNEAHGPDKSILKLADKKITIPGSGKAESLNVASAAAVILAELTK